jgi:hypothetical protein
VEELYDKAGKPEKNDLGIEQEWEVDKDNMGPDLIIDEIKAAIKEMKNGKAEGYDEIPAEFWKLLGETALGKIEELCQDIYVKGRWPGDFTKSVLIPIPKKSNADECGDYRTISLIPHISKILLRILNKRIESKVQEYISRSQFGFRKGVGTRDAIGVLRMMIERSIDFDNEVYVCFVDFEKAFDRVNWVKLMAILKNVGVDWRDRRLIADLYMNQEVMVRIEGECTEAAEVGRGVRQGCLLSPLLFSLYAEAMMKEALEDIDEGIKVGGQLVKDVRFADDQAMTASSENGLQIMMDRLNNTAKDFGMRVNINKTKVMRISKKGEGIVNIMLDGQKIEQVKKFKYLGTWITEDGRCDLEIKSRIAMAKEAFSGIRDLITRNLRKDIKKRIIKTMVWSVALYACETWVLKEEEKRKLEAFEMWLWRKMEKISYTEHMSNVRVLERVNEERNLIKTIVKRRKNWIGHVLRGDNLLKLVIEGRMEGKRGRGRKRKGMLDDLLDKGSYADLKRRALCKETWRIWLPMTCLRTEH